MDGIEHRFRHGIDGCRRMGAPQRRCRTASFAAVRAGPVALHEILQKLVEALSLFFVVSALLTLDEAGLGLQSLGLARANSG